MGSYPASMNGNTVMQENTENERIITGPLTPPCPAFRTKV